MDAVGLGAVGLDAVELDAVGLDAVGLDAVTLGAAVDKLVPTAAASDTEPRDTASPKGARLADADRGFAASGDIELVDIAPDGISLERVGADCIALGEINFDDEEPERVEAVLDDETFDEAELVEAALDDADPEVPSEDNPSGLVEIAVDCADPDAAGKDAERRASTRCKATRRRLRATSVIAVGCATLASADDKRVGVAVTEPVRAD